MKNVHNAIKYLDILHVPISAWPVVNLLQALVILRSSANSAFQLDPALKRRNHIRDKANIWSTTNCGHAHQHWHCLSLAKKSADSPAKIRNSALNFTIVNILQMDDINADAVYVRRLSLYYQNNIDYILYLGWAANNWLAIRRFTRFLLDMQVYTQYKSDECSCFLIRQSQQASPCI